ncbi:MAG TPA: hypothetical protein VNB64_08805 [Solirubrobacteraceae bacterium]|nr:hypothetical protein [Solirubrobacteraceae bacterium]
MAAAVVVVAFRAGLGLDRRAVERPPAAERPAGAAADPALEALGRSLTGLRVRTEGGEVVAAAPAGEASVVMVSSVTCGYCERSLRDLAGMAGGRPLPRLRVVTLEGAGPGAEMLERTGIRGAVSTGPTGDAEQVLLTFRIPGTPIFASVDSLGRLSEVVPGYPGPEGLAPLFRVMAGP